MLSLKRLTNKESNYQALYEWYQDEEVTSAFEQKSLSINEIKNKYYPRTLKNTNVFVYLIFYQNKPIGLIQYQKISLENLKLYKINDGYEIDIFIGSKKYRNKGLGTSSINILTNYLHKKGITTVVLCPLSSNKIAINCYLKCNYKINGVFITKDTQGTNKEYVLMINKP